MRFFAVEAVTAGSFEIVDAGGKQENFSVNLEYYINKYLSPWRIFWLALIIMIPMVLAEKIPERDLAGRYAPMAEAFARGDWKFAFHPRVPALHPFLAGLVAMLTGCGGFLACKIVSSLLYAFCVFPAYALFRRVFTREAALLGALMTVLCSHLIRMGYSGLRESLKEFAVLLGIYALTAIFQDRDKYRGYFCAAVAAAILATCRADIVLYALLILGAGLAMDWHCRGKWRLPWRSLAAALLALVLISPSLWYNYRTIGYPVPEARIGIVMSRVMPILYNSAAPVKLPKHEGAVEKDAGAPSGGGFSSLELSAAGGGKPSSPDKESWFRDFRINGEMTLDFVQSVIDGFYPFFLVLAIPVIVIRIRNKQWKFEETLILGGLLAHALIVILQIMVFDRYLYVSTRYLTPAAPLAFGWAALGIIRLVDRLRSRFFGRITPPWMLAVALLVAALLIVDGMGPLIKDFSSKKKSGQRQASLAIASWLRQDFSSHPPLIDRQLNWESYLPNRAPVIFGGDLRVVGYLAGGQDFDHKFPCPPDYVVIKLQAGNGTDGPAIRNGRMVKEFRIAGGIYRIYRRNDL